MMELVGPMTLRPGSRLQRAEGVCIRLDGSEGARIQAGPGQPFFECGRFALSLLEAVSQPLTLEEAEQKLHGRVSGPQDWMDLMDTLLELHRIGVLVSVGEESPGLAATGYGAAPVHIAMLEDRVRTDSFLAAIREVVRPGDVVVDLGTGSGVLAVAAAAAGARKVYAVESSGIADLAAEVARANGCSDRVQVVRGWSTQVELPERADVLVSEMIGSDPLDEGILEMTADARRRLLVPGARLIPARIEVFASLLRVPPAVRRSATFTPEAIRRWQEGYGIDFSPLLLASCGRPQLRWTRPYEARGWPTICDPVSMAAVDLADVHPLTAEQRVDVTVTRGGEISGILVFFEVTLGPATRLSTDPARVAASNHWRSPLWVLGESLEVLPGDQLQLSYRYRKGGSEVTCRRLAVD